MIFVYTDKHVDRQNNLLRDAKNFDGQIGRKKKKYRLISYAMKSFKDFESTLKRCNDLAFDFNSLPNLHSCVRRNWQNSH